MAARRTAVVHAELLGVEVGHWCNTCRLSTGVRAWLILTVGGLLSLRGGFGCRECGGEDVTVEPGVETVWND